jgi:hypothetical protein
MATNQRNSHELAIAMAVAAIHDPSLDPQYRYRISIRDFRAIAKLDVRRQSVDLHCGESPRDVIQPGAQDKALPVAPYQPSQLDGLTLAELQRRRERLLKLVRKP